MAYRKDALERVGGFDAVHRVAGDDVDVCWKLLARSERIAFSPGGFVWHHRRSNLRAFLRQQKGYGYAEGHLKRTYPGRFNVFGHLVWPGLVYDGLHNGMRLTGLPALLPSRVYQGRFGGAPFQALYQRFPTWSFQIFLTAEWQSITACVLAAAALQTPWSPWSGLGLLVLGCALMLGTIGAAATTGWYACRAKRWRGGAAWRGGALVAFLYVSQPLVRVYGQLLGWWHTRRSPRRWPAEQCLWGNISQRDQWLEHLLQHARRCGWSCQPACEWDDYDLEITGPGPYRVTLSSVAEERLEKGWFQVRFRVNARIKPLAVLINAALLSTVPIFVLAPRLLPLAVPVMVLLRIQWTARARTTAAIAQLAMECAEALGMPNAEGYRC